jgi:hypothetical protein
MSDERFKVQDENFTNVDPEYANYAVDTDKPGEQKLPKLDPNLPLQFANGEVPAERKEAEKNEEKEESKEDDKESKTSAVAPATSPAKPAVK